MAIPTPNNKATIGLDEESKQALRQVSDNVKNAGRNFATNVKRNAKVRERSGQAVKASGRGLRSAAIGATFAGTQNPLAAKAVQKSIDAITSLPKSLSNTFSKLTGLFKEDKPQEKTNKKLEEVSKNQTSQKGVFTDILNVMKDIRENLDKMLGIDREQLMAQKELERERDAQRLINLERQREQSRKQPRDELGRFMKIQPEEAQADAKTAFFAGGFFGNLLSSIQGALAALLTVGFWKKGLKMLLRVGGKFGPLAIITGIFAAIKGGVEGFIESEKDTIWGRIIDGLDSAIGEVMEFLSFGLIDSEKAQNFISDLREDFQNFVKRMVEKVKDILGFSERNISGDKIGDTIIDRETGRAKTITDIENTGPGPSTIIFKDKESGETGEVTEDRLNNKFRREGSLTPGSTSVPTNQSDTDKAISDAAREFGVSESALRKMAFFESRMDPTARNPNTSAKGLFQITDATEDLISKNLGVSGNAMNARDAARMAAALAKNDADAFERMFGYKPNDAQIQAIHLLGRSTAFKAFDRPNTNIGEIDKAAVRYNPFLKGKNINEAVEAIANIQSRTPKKNTFAEGDREEPVITIPSPNIQPNPSARQGMSEKMEEGAKRNLGTQRPGAAQTGSLIAPIVNNDNKQISQTSNFGPPAKSGSSESTTASLNKLMQQGMV